jgi:hypothetical protein
MGWWQVNADTLAGSRFVLSPLAETTACLMVLAKGVPGRALADSGVPSELIMVPGADHVSR